MEREADNAAMQRLEVFVDEWGTVADFPNVPPSDLRGRTVFEWMPGKRFLVQRWDVPYPAAPDGIAIIGFDARLGTYRQHYFDSRGVARVYEMGFADGLWTLLRQTPDVSPLDFAQRFSGTFSDDAMRIAGAWERSTGGANWEHDFDLTYTRSVLPLD